MRSPRFAIGALVFLLAALNLWSSFSRSAIPFELNGIVDSIEVLTEKERGVDDVYLLHIGDWELQVDEAVAQEFHVDRRYEKDAWSSCLREATATFLEPRPCESLDLSRDFWGMAVVMPVVLFVAGGLLIRRKSGQESD